MTVRWLLLAGLTIAGGWLGGAAGLPSAYLFSALVAGLAVALSPVAAPELPAPWFVAAQALLGVVLGTYLESSTLGSLGEDWLPVAVVSLGTLALTTVAGLALGRMAHIDRATASLGMIAGGASGIVAIARDLGGDDRLVAFMQYLRVLVIVLLTPVFVRIAFPGHATAGPGVDDGPILGGLDGWLLAAAVAPVGLVAARLVRLPAGALLGPMLLTAALTLSGAVEGVAVPPLLRDVAFAVIGVQVGLRFTMDAVRAVRRLLVPVFGSIALLIAGCAALAWLLSVTADVSFFDAYLATTPGGLYAVLAIAFGAGANTTFVLAVQGLRLLVMVLAAPAVVRLLLHRAPARAPVPDTT
jgi:membrane AbrB-like protein